TAARDELLHASCPDFHDLTIPIADLDDTTATLDAPTCPHHAILWALLAGRIDPASPLADALGGTFGHATPLPTTYTLPPEPPAAPVAPETPSAWTVYGIHQAVQGVVSLDLMLAAWRALSPADRAIVKYDAH